MVFCEKCVLRNFTKFTGKHLCWSLFFNKEKTMTKVFSDKVWKISKNNFFTEHLRTTASKSCAVKIKMRRKRISYKEDRQVRLQVTTIDYELPQVITSKHCSKNEVFHSVNVTNSPGNCRLRVIISDYK